MKVVEYKKAKGVFSSKSTGKWDLLDDKGNVIKRFPSKADADIWKNKLENNISYAISPEEIRKIGNRLI